MLEIEFDTEPPLEKSREYQAIVLLAQEAEPRLRSLRRACEIVQDTSFLERFSSVLIGDALQKKDIAQVVQMIERAQGRLTKLLTEADQAGTIDSSEKSRLQEGIPAVYKIMGRMKARALKIAEVPQDVSDVISSLANTQTDAHLVLPYLTKRAAETESEPQQ